MVGASGIEPETSAMSTQRSYQLSYAPHAADHTSVVPMQYVLLPFPASCLATLLTGSPRNRAHAGLYRSLLDTPLRVNPSCLQVGRGYIYP